MYLARSPFYFIVESYTLKQQSYDVLIATGGLYPAFNLIAVIADDIFVVGAADDRILRTISMDCLDAKAATSTMAWIDHDHRGLCSLAKGYSKSGAVIVAAVRA